MTDERQNLPSASEVHRIAACPGMLNLKRKLPAREEESSPDAVSGTRIASVLEGKLSVDELTEDEFKTWQMLQNGRTKIVAAVFGADTQVELRREERLWLTNDRGPFFSGKYDALYINGTTALCVDDKSGRNEVTQAAENLQLRALAVLIQANVGNVIFDSVVVAINQPWASPPFSLAEYTKDDILLAHKELIFALYNAGMESAPLIPGPHCQYCKCRGVNCTAVQADVKSQIALAPPNMELATNNQIAAFLDWVDEFDPVATVKAAQDEAKRRIKAGESVGTWMLKSNAPLQPITDSELVFGRFCVLGGTSEAFMGCVEIAKGKLESAVKKATGKKGKLLDEAMDDLLAGATTEKPKADSLKKASEGASNSVDERTPRQPH